jgi:hypothetical protein
MNGKIDKVNLRVHKKTSSEKGGFFIFSESLIQNMMQYNVSVAYQAVYVFVYHS